MTYLLVSKKKYPKIGKKLTIGILCVIFLVSLFYLFKPYSLPVIRLIKPIFIFGREFKQNMKAGIIYSMPDMMLKKENLLLKEEITKLREKNFEKEIIQAENKHLLERLSYLQESDIVSASILLMPPAIPYDTLIIDRGKREGVSIGTRVLFGERLVLGEVENVWQDYSSVRLYSSSGMRVNAVIERTGTMVEIIGEGGGNFKVEVPIDFDIKEGDILVLPGVPTRAVALAIEVETNRTSSFVVAYLRLPAPLTASSPVYVVQ